MGDSDFVLLPLRIVVFGLKYLTFDLLYFTLITSKLIIFPIFEFQLSLKSSHSKSSLNFISEFYLDMQVYIPSCVEEF